MKKYLLSLSCVCVALCVAAGNPSAVASNDEPDQNVATSAETESTGDSQDGTILMKIRPWGGQDQQGAGGRKKTPIGPRSPIPGVKGDGLMSSTVGGGFPSGTNNGSGQLQSTLSGHNDTSWPRIYSFERNNNVWEVNNYVINGGGFRPTPIPKPGKPGGTGGTGGTTTQGTSGFPGFDTVLSKPGPASGVNSIESVTSMIDQLLTEGASEDLSIDSVTNMIDNLLLSK